MKRIWLFVLLMVCFAVPAFAGVMDILVSAKDWIGGNAVALIITAILAIGGLGALIARYTPVLAAVGWLLIEIDSAASDKKISKEELSKLKERFNAIRKAING